MCTAFAEVRVTEDVSHLRVPAVVNGPPESTEFFAWGLPAQQSFLWSIPVPCASTGAACQVLFEAFHLLFSSSHMA